MTNIDHPYSILRKEYKLSQTDIARVAGISPQTVMRTEQGLYATPSAKLVSALMEACPGTDENSLISDHLNWVTRIRVKNYGHIREGVELYNVGGTLPFYKYFSASVAGFCKLLCVQLSIVQRWNFEGAMPPIVYDAMRESGVESSVLNRANEKLAATSR
jgi:DNA-binding XRE family transcriptional regulator